MLPPATSPTMVGRAAELAAVREAHAATFSGAPRGVVVAGEAGIGKTRLLEEVLRGLGDDVVVGRGQCVARGSLAAPFAPLREVLRDLLAHFGVDLFLQAAGPTGRLLPALLPELADGPPGEIAQSQLYDAVSLLLQELSAHAPLLVLVEDVHWADLPTLDLLRELLHVLRRGRVLVVLSYRTDDVGRDHPLRPFLQEVDRSRGVTRVELDRLTTEETLAQARAILGREADDEDLRVLVGRSDGVPFLVEELLAVDGGPGAPLPETLRELVLARYSRLPIATQSVLRLLAAGGVRVDHDLLARVHDGDPAALDAALRQAVGTQVLRTDGTAYTFRHALTQEAVHAELLPGERSRFHARYAEVLEGAAGAGRSAEVAHHWLAAHAPAKAFPALVRASQEAAAAGAPVSSAELAEQALALWDQVPDAAALAGSLRLELVRSTALTYATAGHPRAVAVLDDALATAGGEDVHDRALLLHDAMMVRHSSGLEDFLETGHAALALLPEEDDDEGLAVRARVQCGLACAMLIKPEPGGVQMMQGAMEVARDLARRSEDPQIVERAHFELRRGLTNLAWELYRTHDSAGALAALAEVQAIIGEDVQARLRHDDRASRILLGLGRTAQARDLAERGAEFAREVGMAGGWGTNLALTLARAQLALGALDAAAATLTRIRQSQPYEANLASCCALEIGVAVARDDLQTAHDLRLGSHDLLERVRATEVDDDLHFALPLGQLDAARGDLPAAWRQVRRLWVGGQGGAPAQACPLVGLGAGVLAQLRATGQAPPEETSTQAEQRLREVLDAQGADEVVADWHALLAAELSGTGGSDSDPHAWQAAVEAARQGRLPVEVQVHALRRWAQAQLGAGDRDVAGQTLSEARTLAAATGLPRALRLVDELAARAGLLPGLPVSPTGMAAGERALTAREQQVLELVAQGLTNRQIGARLFISDKTASVHVSAILRKLGASTRAQAAARAAHTLGAAGSPVESQVASQPGGQVGSQVGSEAGR